MPRLLLVVIIAVLYFAACEKEKTFQVHDFNALANLSENNDTIQLRMNLSNALVDGIVIPFGSNGDEYLVSNFVIQNLSEKPKKYYYKIFYQNESYKHKEEIDGDQNLNANSNFYGSWLSDDSGFHLTPEISANGSKLVVKDSLQIKGNPRNEKRFFGADPQNPIISENSLNKMIKGIKSNKEWYEQIKKKAIENNVPLKEQIILDAKWNIMSLREKGDINNRWKRNPRTGVYSFLLVVIEEENINKIPSYLQDITTLNLGNNQYENPYYHFLFNSDYNDIGVAKYSSKYLKAYAEIDLSKGIYSNLSKTSKTPDQFEPTNSCDCSDSIFNKAHIEQFFHNIDKNFFFKNTPKVYDVVGDNYTVEQYRIDTANLEKDLVIKDYIRISDEPCATISYDKTEQAIKLRNPGNKDLDHPVKENVGIKSRHGFTYGKFRAKIAFPEIISESGVWNGLTCAFWLIYQEGGWNQRGMCENGYNPVRGKPETGANQDVYSEIDIEIVKTSKYWPKTSYKKGCYKVDDALNDNVMVTVTNWDLACHDPEKFNTGARDFEYLGNTFTLHRWDHWYKALTSKFEYPQEKTLGKPVYFEIEWKPTEIIWRMGEDKDNMVVIGYMNEKNTKIPDNQMVMVVTQEYHNADWWPTAPFNQNYVPYPLRDIKGYIYEMTIE